MKFLESPHPLKSTSCVVLLCLFFSVGVVSILYIIKIPGEQLANAVQQRQQRERNVLKMAISVVLGFAVRWLPRAVLFILHFTNSITLPNCGVPCFFYAVRLMSVANSAINPSMCFLFSGNYRKELQALLR